MSNLLDASSRVALAALLHDLGKFTERARIADNATQDEANRDQYCPRTLDGRLTHVHAAFTGLAFDQVVPPELRTNANLAPFAAWGGKGADDSLINAAARHHRPETLLQWIIASADRLASGFEREEFQTYNTTPDEAPSRKLSHYTTRQETLLERIRLNNRPETSTWRYPLAPLCPNTLFPVPAQTCENDTKTTAQERYRALWEGFRQGLDLIPASHRKNLPLWLDHLDSLWLTFTHAIPSATSGIGGKVRPDVSLYDHSRTTAALAVALWRYHTDLENEPVGVRQQLQAQWDWKRESDDLGQEAWNTPKFLLVQGDFTGIQNFIFSQGSQTQKRAAKLLRGRSFYVSLLSELAALKVLESLELPASSQVVNAAGKFLIVAPNTSETIDRLHTVQAELDTWFLAHTYGQSGIGLAWLPAAASDFRQTAQGENPFQVLMKRLFQQLDEIKLQRLNLCGNTAPASPVFDGFLDRFEHGECRIDGHSPATVEHGGLWMTPLAADQIDTGKWLATCQRVLVTRNNLNHKTLRLPLFGYWVSFTAGQEETGKFGAQAQSGDLVRAWDFSLPVAADDPLWNGYARRAINAYIPRFGAINAWEADRYHGLENPEDFDPHPDEIKTLNHLARDDRRPDPEKPDRWIGAEALMVLKGDVDNLGLIFQKGLETPTFAKMAALSRQMNAFFAVYLPWLCAQEFPNTYTVFAGGDDFFLIGPWHSTLKLAQTMQQEFQRYVAQNPDIHFSAGLAMTKPGLPIRQLADLAEKALDDAKKVPGKNAVTCFGQSVSWGDFNLLMARAQGLDRVAQEHALSTGYLYGLLHLTDMAGKVEERPENALWHSRFAYRTRRLIETQFKQIENRDEREAARRRLQAELAHEIAEAGIKKHTHAYKIALFTHLYQQRD
ncbi:MAG: type III-A CRISPR-associated protein Cas10/Csm1 [Alphaproteobacteria bacterium CG_4_10_14_0_2_um_filter_63_37]|nr:MAG: type III-A CRISPR-associated protein Cas10/Csm1 [Proteobacteria bacterium CG1_02_64_396]PJA23655.1 MAG: type III-A CRISPR-associated protein Cas10/Csm1 [Alphaproteobacteria bacterium CG_4_10_14_0_2_um_filter_63_37]